MVKLIQKKMKAGDMQFADLAASLEELNKALENSHALDVEIVISKEQYNKLKDLGQSDDRWLASLYPVRSTLRIPVP